MDNNTTTSRKGFLKKAGFALAGGGALLGTSKAGASEGADRSQGSSEKLDAYFARRVRPAERAVVRDAQC